MSDKITQFPVLQPINTMSNGSVFSPSGIGGGVKNTGNTGFASVLKGDLVCSRGILGNGTDYWVIDATSMRSANFVSGVSGCCIYYNGNVEFNDGKFRGEIITSSVTLTGGTIRYQKTSFTDSVNAGYYIGSEGIYFGAAADASKLKYSITTGSLDYIGTLSNSAGTIIINASAQTILQGFTFGTTDYSGAFKSGDIAWNTTTGAITGGSGIVMYRKGIVGASAGATTFAIDATTGSASFAGSLVAATGTLGSITAGTFTGITVAIGSANNIFKADSNGIYLGNATFGSAPFRVSMAGEMTCTSGTFSGALSAATGTFSGSLTVGTALDIAVSADFPPDTNLVTYWACDEGQGTTANDGSGNNNPMTLEGATWATGGPAGGWINFDGSDDRGTFVNPLLGKTAFTISIWFYKDSYVQYQSLISDYKNENGAINLIIGYENPENTFRFLVGDGTTNDSVYVAGITVGLHHAILRFDASAGTLDAFVDGAKTTSSTTLTGMGATSYPGGTYTSIGRYSTNYEFDGKIGPVRMYDTALTDAQCYALYKNPGQGKSLAVPVGRLTSGYIYSKQIYLSFVDTMGDSFIACGKTDFPTYAAETGITMPDENGLIMGIDDSDSNKAKFCVGNKTEYLAVIGAELFNTLKSSRHTNGDIVEDEDTHNDVGGVELIHTNTESSTNSTSFVLLKKITVGRRGEYGLYWDYFYNTAGESYYADFELRIYHAATTTEDSAFSSVRVLGQGGIFYKTKKIYNLLQGDQIRLYAKLEQTDSGGVAKNRYFCLFADQDYDIPVAPTETSYYTS